MPSNNELYHHGVLGMKWGIRRYQDYGEGGYDPKNRGRKTKSEESSPSKDKKGLSEATKKKLKIGAAILGTAAVAAGAAYVANNASKIINSKITSELSKKYMKDGQRFFDSAVKDDIKLHDRAMKSVSKSRLTNADENKAWRDELSVFKKSADDNYAKSKAAFKKANDMDFSKQEKRDMFNTMYIKPLKEKIRR